MPDFAIKMWERVWELRDTMPASWTQEELSEEEMIELIAPMLACHVSKEYVENRLEIVRAVHGEGVNKHGPVPDEYKAKPGVGTLTRVLGGAMSQLSRMRAGSFDEVDRYLEGKVPAMLVLFDDRKNPPEARYHTWVPNDLKERLGLKSERGGE